MCTMISTLNMPREEWLQLRKSGIGGSDAGAICGLNSYASPMSVYRDKTSEDLSDLDNETMRQGRDLEDYVAHRFMEATGLKVRHSNMMYRNEDHPFMIADVDRLIVGEDAGLECKTCSAYNADKWKDGEVPLHYLMQCCHYMVVTGRSAWYIAVVILGQDFKFARIDRDDSLIEKLVAIEDTFWNQHFASSDHYRVSWSSVDTARLDTKRLKAEKPDIYQNFAKITSSRRLTIKAAS